MSTIIHKIYYSNNFWYRETLFNSHLTTVKSYKITLEPAAWFPWQH